MSRLKTNKLNLLLTNWPSNAVYACSWMHGQGYSYELIDKYRKSQWLVPVGHGAVARAGDTITWEGGLYTIQRQLNLLIHVGSKSALLVKGYGHFVPQGKNWTLTLFASPTTKLPAWFKSYKWGVKLEYMTSSLFRGSQKQTLSDFDKGSFAIKVAAPELAMMEMLSLVPQRESLEEAKLLMEGLSTLRPQLVQNLLENCSSLKVKRLFLFLAEECHHEWMKELNLKKIKLGKGRRVIEKGGVWHPKYLITVPKDMMQKENKNKL